MSEGPIAQPNSSPIIVDGEEEVKGESKEITGDSTGSDELNL